MRVYFKVLKKFHDNQTDNFKFLSDFLLIAASLSIFSIGVFTLVAYAFPATTSEFFPLFENITKVFSEITLGYFLFVLITTFLIFKLSKRKSLSSFFDIFFGIDENSKVAETTNRKIQIDVESLRKKIKEIENLKSSDLTNEDKNKIVQDLSNNISESVSDNVLEKIKKEHSAEFRNDYRLQSVRNIIEDNIRRLSRERQTITTWTLLNLFAGLASAGLGAYLLYYTVSELKIPEINLDKNNAVTVLIISFCARLSLVIIIEIFAYFFLNLYRTGLQEIKYYQNEISNTLSKQAGIQTALLSEDESLALQITINLMNTERNFILKKGEATIGLEQNKLDRTADNQMLNEITDAVKATIQKTSPARTTRTPKTTK